MRSLTISGVNEAYEPSAVLEGTLQWHASFTPKHIEIKLFWYTQGKGTTDIEVLETLTLPDKNPQGSKRFEFRLPQAPYSFSGQLISLLWAVEAIVDPGEHTCRHNFILAPEGKERILNSHASA